MRLDWHPEIAMNLAKEKAEAALTLIGALGVGWVSDQLRANGSVVTGNLVNSITYATSQEQGPVKGKTNGKPLTRALPLTVKIGTTVVYGPRVEFGFVGRDSLGRNYHQRAKPYLRTAIKLHEKDVMSVFAKAGRG